MNRIKQLLQERILILDGAMGTMIQQYQLKEEDYKGNVFAHLTQQMKGNNDILNITRPELIKAIHKQYLEAGADIIETNSFNSSAISMADYGIESYVRELNLAAARIAKEAAKEYTDKNPDKPRFVAGSIGPTNKSASISPDVTNPALRAITFDELYTAFLEQIEALIEGGIDILLIETAFDTLNVKAALIAAEEAMRKHRKVPIMLSFTVAGKSGRILSGQTIEAALVSLAQFELLSVGLNCSFGACDMKPFLKEIGEAASCYVSAYPNAGLPNSLGEYDETPETMARQLQEFLDEGLVNILGGCCGTTPQHIAAMASLDLSKRRTKIAEPANCLNLAGLDVLSISPDSRFVNIGERCNVAGSRKFLRLIKEQNYEEAAAIARKQVEDGALILDINLDDGLIDGEKEMIHFLNLISSDPDIAKIPFMIDSSDWNIIEAGLRRIQGKAVVNSISLKNGEEDFLSKAKKIKQYGAAIVAMAFDEEGQATSFERKIEICERMYFLLTTKIGFNPNDIIFDPNILAIGTGIEEHAGYAVDFIRATRWIKQNLPYAKVSGGVSNLSFSFRGNNYLREAMHAVFLYHAIKEGMDMGIVNPSTAVVYEDIPKPLLLLIEDLIFNRKPDAAEKLIEWSNDNQATGEISFVKQNQQIWRTYPLDERLQYALTKGITEYLDEDMAEALKIYPNPIEIIDKPLMQGLSIVGKLFAEGKMFLPQVVKSARTMQKAVAILQPFIESSKTQSAAKAGKILIATVKGDVHDIGKNITSLILSCNNYEVIDLGVMVASGEIIAQAKEHQVDIVALSGLITPSLQEMTIVASEMQKAGLSQPLLIGGATTSKLHTALKIDPLYQGAVVYVPDASLAPLAANRLLNGKSKIEYINEIKQNCKLLREQSQTNQTELVSLHYAQENPYKIDWEKYIPPVPLFTGNQIVETVSLDEVIPLINWKAFLAAWKLPSREENAAKLMEEAKAVLGKWQADNYQPVKAIIGFYPVDRQGETLCIEGYEVPFVRQQELRDDNTYKSLVDYIKPSGDYMGLFAVSVSPRVKSADWQETDTYQEMLEEILCHRLAEAATEYIHRLVNTTYWPGSQGIRPASGYPMIPDISLNFVIENILQTNRIGMALTPNGAIYPTASTAGLLIAHPESSYFHIGQIGDDQLQHYAEARKISIDEAKRWLGR